ncbi:MAG: protein kinase, partial [Acidobacteriota bacterium]
MARPPRALLLEPDPVVSGLLGGLLEGEGFQVGSVRAPSEVALRARRSSVDLVILNNEHGSAVPQVVAELRAWAGADSLTILAISGAKGEGASDLIAAGADDCLPKPLVLSEVRSRVGARMRSRGRLSSGGLTPPIGVGSVLDGKFRLEEELGRGNFGTVYAARHLNLERQVAIKILHNKFSSREEVERRLRLEGVSTCQIDHPNAVKVFDLSLTRSGESYLVMELLH